MIATFITLQGKQAESMDVALHSIKTATLSVMLFDSRDITAGNMPGL